MPSNLYGVANAPIVTALVSFGTTSCPAGATTVIGGTSPIIAPSQGFFYPATWWMLDVTYGASLPTGVIYSFRIGAGSNLDAVQLEPATAVPSATFNTTVCMFGPASSTPWVAPGSVINYCVTPTGQAVTTNPGAGRAWFALFRAPDQ